MKRGKISNNVIRRLPRYLSKLNELAESGTERISSGELGSQMGLTASQIRQDFSCFGEFGQQGYGYPVEGLRRAIADILGMNRGYSTILVGVGNLGHALAANFDFKGNGFALLAAFDVDRSLIGGEIAGIPIYSMGDMGDFIRSNEVDVAVVAVPRDEARNVAAYLRRSGIRAICNFTNTEMGLRDTEVLVEDIHFSDSFLALSYYLTERDRAVGRQEETGEGG